MRLNYLINPSSMCMWAVACSTGCRLAIAMVRYRKNMNRVHVGFRSGLGNRTVDADFCDSGPLRWRTRIIPVVVLHIELKGACV